jgi:hypothetical protein
MYRKYQFTVLLKTFKKYSSRDTIPFNLTTDWMFLPSMLAWKLMSVASSSMGNRNTHSTGVSLLEEAQ